MTAQFDPGSDDPEAKRARAAPGLLDSELANSVRESAQQIWLAGMGAFAKAQEEGTRVFEALVKEGQSLQQKTHVAAEDRISEIASKVSAIAETVGAKASQNFDKLEGIFEARTAKAMGRLGVPTAEEMRALMQRVEALEAAMARLSRPPRKPAPTSAAEPAADPTVTRSTRRPAT
jgi:poly(hydroxyalkanoate) granule-associated protein